MSDQLLVVGLGIGDDADAALFLSGLAMEDDTPVVPTYGVTSTTGYVTSSSAVASGAPATSVASHVLATITTDGSQ
jgi:hypothetical protein